MRVSIAYAEPVNQYWKEIDVPDDATVEDVINLSGILNQFPEIDLDNQKIGIFGKAAKMDKAVSAGDRVEIYRPITADPETVPRRDEDE